MKGETNIWEGIGQTAYVLISLVLAIVISGFVFTFAWGWFIVPIFNIRPITIPEAIGLTLVIRLFKTVKRDKNTSLASYTSSFIFSLLNNMIFLGIAWLVRFFV